ncbi:MAG: sensor histidine kinase [Thermoplasmatota archaeon]
MQKRGCMQDGGRGRSYVVPRTIGDRNEESERKSGPPDAQLLSRFFSNITASGEISDIADVLSKDLPPIVPFEIGSLRWMQYTSYGEDWGMDLLEDEFPESIDFIATGNALRGAMDLRIDGSIEDGAEGHGGDDMEPVCRARMENGDPVFIKLRSGMMIPLSDGDKEVGVLSLFSSKEGVLEGMDRDALLSHIWTAVGATLARVLKDSGVRSELDRSRELLDSSEDLLILWRSSDSMWEIECNRKAERFINNPDLCPGMMEGPFFAPPGKEWERANFAWTRAFEAGETYQLDLELLDPCGERGSYLCTFSPFLIEGDIQGVKMTGMEIAKLDRAMGNLERLNRGYRLILSVLTHDLRNPLSAVSGYTELMRLDDGTNKDRYMERIQRMTTRMDQTLKLATLLTEVQEGKVEGDFEEIDLPLLIENCVEMLRHRLDDRSFNFIHEGSSFRIKGHPFLEHVVMNIMDNALKYSPGGSVVDIELLTGLDGLTLSVRDRGAGVSDDHKLSIFERFERGSKKDGISGTGLGLAISKGIVDLHKGRIWVEDNEPTGSDFRVFLPWDPSG